MPSQRGVVSQLSTEGLWTVEERGPGESGESGGVQGGGGLGAGGGGQRISKPLRGLVFKNQVSEESCCQIVVLLSLFCLILDLIPTPLSLVVVLAQISSVVDST